MVLVLAALAVVVPDRESSHLFSTMVS